jgi:hypothetical protein
MTNSRSQVEALFARLDAWRHLPNYQLERRADIFFSLYLSEVVGEVLELEMEPEVVPELPIKRDLIWPDPPSNRSVKVDYMLTAVDRSRVVFVELKTDTRSRREDQDNYLRRAREIGLRVVIEGLRAILVATSAHQKYHHLASALSRVGFLTMPDDIEQYLFPRVRPGLRERLGRISPRDILPPIEIVYVQPKPSDTACSIDFRRFADIVDRHNDEVSQRFARSLRAWTSKAGHFRP